MLAGGGSPPDLQIRFGLTPQSLDQPLAGGKSYQISSDCFLLDIDETARYLVRGGREIVVETHPSAPEKAIRLFLLGSAFGALLLQRGTWPFHGSAVAAGSGAVLFAGPSGVGKSTLAGIFYRRGYPVLADDVCALTVGAGSEVQLWPAYPRLNLWADALLQLGVITGEHPSSHDTITKYEYPLDHFSSDPVRVTTIYTLNIGREDDITLNTLEGFEKMKALTANTYRLHFLKGMQLERNHFLQAQSLARQARVVQVTRPVESHPPDILANRLERDFSP